MSKSFRRMVIAAASLAAAVVGGATRHAGASSCPGSECTGTFCTPAGSCSIVHCSTNTTCGDPDVSDYYLYTADKYTCTTGPSPCYDNPQLSGFVTCGCLGT
jgi:hypothetical protein